MFGSKIILKRILNYKETLEYMKLLIKLTLITFVSTLLVSCGGKSSKDSLTGWTSKDKSTAGFSSNKQYKGQQTPPGMVLIEGGTFTMGHVIDDVMFDWNTTPQQQQVRSFYMDEAEVTNEEYLFYLEFLHKVFPPDNENYKYIYMAALPDTLVWRDRLGFNESLTETYLRHPAYAKYPVVGVSWVQASEYCKWRTDRVNEKILMDKGVLKNLFQLDSLNVEGKNHFVTETYLMDPTYLFDGDSTVYKKGLPENKVRKRGEPRPSRGQFQGRHVKMSDGIVMPKFRLPTETEWEFAAKATSENREYNNLVGRKKFPWNGRYTRNKSKRAQGDQLANFKLAKGDYSGVSGWTNDGGDITIAVKSYPPNAFGLYDMAGNVAEWVADVYRPIIDTEANDFNYFRGNVFSKPKINRDGKVVIADYSTIDYDTLDNGRIVPSDLPGDIMYVPITKRDAFMRNNYEKSYNVDYKDGDLSSTRQFSDDEDEMEVKPRMYNHPIIPKEIGEGGMRRQIYDDKVRRTLVSDKTRVYKGGSWKDREYWLDPAQRRYLPQYSATNFIGFRCAMDRLGPMSQERRKAFPSNSK
jgi:gliding motility-associated lipoprotein GldJ